MNLSMYNEIGQFQLFFIDQGYKRADNVYKNVEDIPDGYILEKDGIKFYKLY